MDEQTKDDIEYVGARTAAALLELLPGGSLLSGALLTPVEIAERRRNSRLLASIASDVQALQAAGRLDVEELASSETFLANLTSVLRDMQSTSNEEKRRLLRNGLLNFELDAPDPTIGEIFLRMLGRYTTLHVRVLQFIEPLPAFVSAEKSYPIVDGKPSGVMRDLSAMCREVFDFPGELLDSVLAELADDGLIVMTQPNTYMIADLGTPRNADTISGFGRQFLEFVRSPSPEPH